MNRMFPSVWLRPASSSSELDRFIHDFWSDAPVAPGVAPFTEGAPALNAFETPQAFEIELELPGMALSEIEVMVEGRDLCVRGERKIALPKDGTWQRRERLHGKFERTVRLPAEIDVVHVQAQLHQGVLRVTCPKSEDAKARKILVQARVPSQPLQ